jgi:hypothetical protein
VKLTMHSLLAEMAKPYCSNFNGIGVALLFLEPRRCQTYQWTMLTVGLNWRPWSRVITFRNPDDAWYSTMLEFVVSAVWYLRSTDRGIWLDQGASSFVHSWTSCHLCDGITNCFPLVHARPNRPRRWIDFPACFSDHFSCRNYG